jgi:putative addiction module CopG family antidote
VQLEIPPDLTQFVSVEVASGHFSTPEEVIVAALRLLKQDRDNAVAGIQEGLAQSHRGEGVPLDEVFARIRAKHGIPGNA